MLKIVEVGPRDGLQNESVIFPTRAKVAFIDVLSETGVDEIEVSAFVSPRKVPQLGDAEQVFGRISRKDGVVYSALVPNLQGLERAVSAGVDKVSVFTAASETFNQKNINTSVQGSLQRFQTLIERSRRIGLPVRGYISTAFWCAFEGKIPRQNVIELTQRLFDMGVKEVSLSDTIGKATPDEVARLLDDLLPKVSADRIAVHFHDTYGKGVENVLKSWSYGVTTFDASVGGLGGCPFAPGATGNVATEAVVSALLGKGAPVAVDIDRLADARLILEPFLVERRRTVPAGGSIACAVCEFYREDVCCGRADDSN